MEYSTEQISKAIFIDVRYSYEGLCMCLPGVVSVPSATLIGHLHASYTKLNDIELTFNIIHALS
jgi:hypothetical protein